MQRTRRRRTRAPRRRRRATRRRRVGGALFSINARPSMIYDIKDTGAKNGKRKGLVYSIQRYDRRAEDKPPCKTNQMGRAIDYVEDTLALISKGPTKTFAPDQKYREMFEVKGV
jgi:hypothetical protein